MYIDYWSLKKGELMTNNKTVISTTIRFILFFAFLIVIIMCINIVGEGTMTNRESTLLGILIAVLSVLASWIITELYANFLIVRLWRKLMATLERAIEIAAIFHSGQVDKAGQPYVLHPLRLMFAVHTPQERMAAVLHDVVEDTDMTLADLAREGFSQEVVAAVQALTKLTGESRIDAAHRAAADPIARAVKLADVADNMDLLRITDPSERDFARLKEYEQVRLVLLAAT